MRCGECGCTYESCGSYIPGNKCPHETDDYLISIKNSQSKKENDTERLYDEDGIRIGGVDE